MKDQVLRAVPMISCLVISLTAIRIFPKTSVTQRRLLSLGVAVAAVLGVIFLPEGLWPYAKGLAGGSIGSFILMMLSESQMDKEKV